MKFLVLGNPVESCSDKPWFVDGKKIPNAGKITAEPLSGLRISRLWLSEALEDVRSAVGG